MNIKGFLIKLVTNIQRFLLRYYMVLVPIILGIIFFLLLDGVNRNINSLNIDYLLKGISNHKYLLIAIYSSFLLIVLKPISLNKKSGTLFFLTLIVSGLLLSLKSFINTSNLTLYYILDVVSAFVFTTLIVSLFYSFWGTHIEDLKNIFKEGSEKKHNKKGIFILAIVVLGIGIILRFININGLFPATDAYPYLAGAKDFVKYGITIDYTRFSPLMNIIVFMFENFNVSVAIARIPGIVVSVFFIVISWLLIRKETSHEFSNLYLILVSLNPWIIMQSRVIREYIYLLPVYFLLSFYFYKRIKALFSEKNKLWLFIIDALVIIGFSYYALVFDPLSTAKLGLIFPLVYLLYLLVFIFRKKLIKVTSYLKGYIKWIHVIIFLVIFILFAYLNQRFSIVNLTLAQVNIIPSLSWDWIKYIFFNWEYGTVTIQTIFLILGIFSLFYKGRKYGWNSYLSYMLITFMLIMYVFVFHFGRYFAPRYIFFLLPMIILITTEGINIFIKYIKRIVKVPINTVVLVVLLLNWPFIINAITVSGGGYVSSSGNYHEDFPLICSYINENYANVDAYVSYHVGAMQWCLDSEEKVGKVQNYVYKNPNRIEDLEKIMQEYPTGVFVTEERINQWSKYDVKPPQNLILGGKELKFDKEVSRMIIYYWN